MDAADVTKFLEDFGRSQYYNPCPICPGKLWCVYCTDSDEDGFTSEGGACGPVDCDDGDEGIYPGTTEICEDTIDQDCDGEDLLCILVDGDGDLWASSQGDCCDTGGETSLGCSLETRGEIFPGATDFPGDGIDQDCDGVDDPVPGQEDFDHDGVSFTAGDCNDRLPTVHPGAVEILCNDIDENCNGSDSCGITPTEESYSGYITGEVFNATTFEPLPGAKVLVQGQGELTTDAQGKFAFPVPNTRFYRITVTKSGFTYAQRVMHVERYHAFAVNPIYLTPLDTATTEVGPGGGTHVSSTGEIRVEFPEGALTQQITVSATRYRFGDALPSPLPETSHFTTAVELLPDGLTFETPARVLIENSYNLAPGTLVPVGYYRKDLSLWVPDGMGIITPDGQYMEYWTKHFSSIDFNYPAKAPGGSNPPDGTNETPEKDACQDGNSKDSKVIFKTGELMEDYYLPSFKSLGKTISPRLVYRSLAADPKAFITTRYHLDSQDTTIPETTEFTLKIAGTKKTTHFAGSDGDLKQSYLFDGIDYKGDRIPTGIYPYEIELANWYPTYFYGAHYFGQAGRALIVPPIRAAENERLAESFTGRLPFENLEESPFGAGWSLAGIPRLHIETGQVLMTEGSGSLKVFTSQIIDTIAGGGNPPDDLGDGGPAIEAELQRPWNVAADSFGNIYIADSNHYRIRKVDINGIITTVAGSGTTGYSGDGGLAIAANIRSPMGIAADSFGNFYFPGSYYKNYSYVGHIRKVDTNGIITTVAGEGNPPDGLGDGGPATLAKLNQPLDVEVDSSGNLYIADNNHNRIRKVDLDGIITTVAGDGTMGYYGDGGPAIDARFNYLPGIDIDKVGNLHVADRYNHRIRTIFVGTAASLASINPLKATTPPWCAMRMARILKRLKIEQSTSLMLKGISPPPPISMTIPLPTPILRESSPPSPTPPVR